MVPNAIGQVIPIIKRLHPLVSLARIKPLIIPNIHKKNTQTKGVKRLNMRYIFFRKSVSAGINKKGNGLFNAKAERVVPCFSQVQQCLWLIGVSLQ